MTDLQHAFEAAFGLEGKALDFRLDRLCGDNGKLRKQILELLKDADIDDDFLKVPDRKSKVPVVGLDVGQYRLVESLGEGGFGTVYLAKQRMWPYRQVAIKFLKSELVSRKCKVRFEVERKTMAMMNHPNIVRFHHSGITRDGVPFFAMEFVAGTPITEYCDSRQLDLAARLRLFTQLCKAVNHSHQNGTIHRDLKPGNVLVSDSENSPTVKLIDFGIATRTDQPSPGTNPGESGLPLGTPKYTSPEQVESTKIDARSDVYSMGVLLLELLIGTNPITRREQERHLSRVIIKALAKNPLHRFGTVAEFQSALQPSGL